MRRHDAFREPCPSERLPRNAKSVALQFKTRGIIKKESENHTPSIGLILQSDLLGNVQGTAHITCVWSAFALQVLWSSSTHLSLTISPEIYSTPDEVIECRICGLI